MDDMAFVTKLFEKELEGLESRLKTLRHKKDILDEEINSLQLQLNECNIQIEMIKQLQVKAREMAVPGQRDFESTLQTGGATAKLLAVLRETREPLDMEAILHALGEPDNPKNRDRYRIKAHYLKSRGLVISPQTGLFIARQLEAATPCSDTPNSDSGRATTPIPDGKGGGVAAKTTN